MTTLRFTEEPRLPHLWAAHDTRWRGVSMP